MIPRCNHTSEPEYGKDALCDAVYYLCLLEADHDGDHLYKTETKWGNVTIVYREGFGDARPAPGRENEMRYIHRVVNQDNK